MLPYVITNFWISLDFLIENSISTNFGISPQRFLNFISNLFPTLVKNIKAIYSASQKLLNWNQDHSLKNGFSVQISIKCRL